MSSGRHHHLSFGFLVESPALESHVKDVQDKLTLAETEVVRDAIVSVDLNMGQVEVEFYVTADSRRHAVELASEVLVGAIVDAGGWPRDLLTRDAEGLGSETQVWEQTSLVAA